MNNANRVMADYPLQVKKISMLFDKGKKAVWSIETKEGHVYLKKIPTHKEYLTFMVYAIDFLKKNGVLTPGVVRTASGEPYVFFNGEFYVAFEAVSGRKPVYRNENDLVKIVQGMAQFHKASLDFDLPPDVQPSCALGEWKWSYQKTCEQMTQWKTEKLAAPKKNEFDRKFLHHIDSFLNRAEKAITILDHSCYERWTESTHVHKTLCHLDFAAQNLIIGRDGSLHVLDMDSLRIDLPVRDLRKILNKVMRKQKKWDLEKMIKMMNAYQKVNPLSKEQYTVLMADALFPHLFFEQVSKYYGTREKKWAEQKHVRRLQDMIETEKNKEDVLTAFLARVDEVVNSVR